MRVVSSFLVQKQVHLIAAAGIQHGALIYGSQLGEECKPVPKLEIDWLTLLFLTVTPAIAAAVLLKVKRANRVWIPTNVTETLWFAERRILESIVHANLFVTRIRSST